MRIGDWAVDPEGNEVSLGDRSQRLEPKVIEVLLHLARARGRVVSREELLSAVWPGVIVGDDALTQAIIKLRKALGDDAHKPTYIETISKRGYRLLAPVEDDAPAALAATRRFPRRAIAAAAVALVAVAAGALVIVSSVRMPWPIAPDTRGAARSSIPTVAILPLANLSGDAKREYFSDGVTEDLIDALGRFSGVRVMSRNAVLGFKGKAATPHAIRDELGATYIVQGSMREADGKIRIAVELSDADRGVLIWSERYDADGTALFEVQDRIARTIASTLQIRLTEAERQRIFKKPTESLEAYDLVLRARALLERLDRRMNREARALLARALEIAPDYADASTALGEAELDRARYGWVQDPDAASASAEALAKRALESPDPRAHPRAHSLLAAIYGYQSRFAEALSHTQSAIELNPSDSSAQYRHGEALLHLGRIDEAIVPLEIARRVEPRAIRINLALAYYLAGRYADTVALADSLLARRQDHVALHAARAAALAQLGRIEEARAEADQVRRYSPTFKAEQWVTRMAPEYTSKVHEGLRKAGL